MYKLKHKKPKYLDFDLIVIGTGSGGSVAAHTAAHAGKKVAVVEADTLGGECPNFGCVPTKSLLHAAEVYETTIGGKRYGINASKVTVDYGAVKAWKDTAVRHTGTSEGEDFYKSEGIKVIHGKAHFINPWTISVNGLRYHARQFLIATGTRPVVPPIPGLAEHGFITYREAINLTELPRSIFIIGGGAIGCEFAHLFNTFGVKTTIADMAPRLIPLEDSEVGELIGALMEKRGVDIQVGSKITRVSVEGKQKVVTFEKDGKSHQVKVDEVMLSSGMASNTDMGLENAGVKYDKGGIKVNARMETSQKHIYAAGDVVGPYRFTHMASYQSRVAVHNMYHREKKIRAHYNAVPRCVFVEPEAASVGMTEQQLKDKGFKYQTGVSAISNIGRANTSNSNYGFVKVLADKHGVLLGASIVSPRAGEMIHELTLAIRHNMTARQVAETIHAFPTWSEAVRLACLKVKKT